MCPDEYHAHMQRLYLFIKRFLGVFLLFILVVGLAKYALVSKPPPAGIEESEYTYTSPNAENQQEVKVTGNSCADDHCPACCTKADNEQYKRNEFVSSKRDLNAQEGVWRASNAMAILTAVATIIGGFGVYLLKQTLVATRQTLNATKDATEVVMRSNILQLKPYLSATFKAAEYFQDWDPVDRTQTLGLSVNIENAGQTPASKVFITIGSMSSVSFMRNGANSSADFNRLTDGVLEASKAYISGRSETALLFAKKWRINDRSEWPEDQTNMANGNYDLWTNISANLNDFSIRYKDLECEGENWHKLVSGNIHFALSDSRDIFANDGKLSIRVIEREDDKDHHNYVWPLS